MSDSRFQMSLVLANVVQERGSPVVTSEAAPRDASVPSGATWIRRTSQVIL